MYRITTLCTYYIPEFVLVLWNIDIISTKRTIDPPSYVFFLFHWIYSFHSHSYFFLGVH